VRVAGNDAMLVVNGQILESRAHRAVDAAGGSGRLTREIYVSTDIEADGPCPGPNSMLSIGSAAYTVDATLLGTFSANLETIPGSSAHPDATAWWAAHPEAWAAARRDLQPPEVAMGHYERWLSALPGQPVFVGYPAGFDFMFVYWYLMTFVGSSPFRRMALDVRTYAMALLALPYGDCSREDIAGRWSQTRPHTHNALDDAIEQGEIFCALLQERLGNRHLPEGETHDRR
jgi:hypothetical protein